MNYPTYVASTDEVKIEWTAATEPEKQPFQASMILILGMFAAAVVVIYLIVVGVFTPPPLDTGTLGVEHRSQ